MTYRLIVLYGFGVLCTAFSSGVLAMVSLADIEMAGVAGQDGIQITLDAGAHPVATEAMWRTDTGSAYEAAVMLKGIDAHFVGGAGLEVDVGTDNANTGDPHFGFKAEWTDLRMRFDGFAQSFYRDGSGGNRLLDRSSGILGVNSTGYLHFSNALGPLNFGNPADPATALARLDLNTVGDIFYRQSTASNAPELSFANFNFGVRFTDGAGGLGYGRFGLTSDGLTLQADYMDFDLNFDVFVAGETTQEFDTVSRLPTILFGWQGGIENARISVGQGGIGYGSSLDSSIDPSNTLLFANYAGQYSTRSDGLNANVRWDYGENFRWILGQAAGNRIRVDFFDWRRLGAGTLGEASYDFQIPIIVDAINAVEGPGGICTGGNIPVSGMLTNTSCGAVSGTFYNVPPKDGAIAVVIRDGRLHAYNSQVRLNDVDGLGNPVIDRFDWSLLYTFGKLDANLYFYPDGQYDAVTGEFAGKLRNDVLLAIQSPGYWRAAQENFASYNMALVPGDVGYFDNPANRWATNTHFLIADTDINNVATGLTPSVAVLNSRQSFGIGLLNADLIWRADDFQVSLVGSGTPPTADPSRADYFRTSTQFPGLWLETSNLAKYQFRGLFGGGNLSDLSRPVRIALLDINLETTDFIFVLGPPRAPGDQYVAFDGLFNFSSNAYISLAEPSSPTASFSLANVTGQMMWVNGKIELESALTTGDRPRLTIANDMLLGGTALGGGPLIGDVRLGADRLGSLAIPTGQITSSFSLTPQ